MQRFVQEKENSLDSKSNNPLIVQVNRENKSFVILKPENEVIQMYHSQRLHDLLTERSEENENIVLDLSKVRYLDSTIMGTLFTHSKKLKEKNLNLSIINVKHALKLLFKVTKSYSLLNIYDSLGDLVKAVKWAPKKA